MMNEVTEKKLTEQPKLEINTSRHFTSWLAEQKVSLSFTTYQTGKVFKSVAEKTLSSGDYNLELNVSDLSSGVWFIEVESSEREVMKFIKK